MQKKNNLLSSTRAYFVQQKTDSVIGAISGSHALNQVLPKATMRQVSKDSVIHASNLLSASRSLKLIGNPLVNNGKKSQIQKKKVVRRMPWPKQHVRKIPLRTV